MSRPSLLRRERHLFPLFAVSVDRGRISGRWTAYAKPTDDVDAPWVQVTRQQLLDLRRAVTPELITAILAGGGHGVSVDLATLGALSRRGLIVRTGGRYVLTEAGQQALATLAVAR